MMNITNLKTKTLLMATLVAFGALVSSCDKAEEQGKGAYEQSKGVYSFNEYTETEDDVLKLTYSMTKYNATTNTFDEQAVHSTALNTFAKTYTNISYTICLDNVLYGLASTENEETDKAFIIKYDFGSLTGNMVREFTEDELDYSTGIFVVYNGTMCMLKLVSEEVLSLVNLDGEEVKKFGPIASIEEVSYSDDKYIFIRTSGEVSGSCSISLTGTNTIVTNEVEPISVSISANGKYYGSDGSDYYEIDPTTMKKKGVTLGSSKYNFSLHSASQKKAFGTNYENSINFISIYDEATKKTSEISSGESFPTLFEIK